MEISTLSSPFAGPLWFAQALWFIQALPWPLLAFASYLASITVGVLSMRGHRLRRVWHGRLFILTCVLTVLGAILSFPERWGQGLALLFALIPLALLPLFGAPVAKRPRQHALIALAASPCYLAALVLWAVSLG